MAIDYEGALYWKERSLQLLLALDKVRDTLGVDADPYTMFQRIVVLLRSQLEADAAAIAVLKAQEAGIDYLLAEGMSHEQAADLCLRAARRQGTGPVVTPTWAHTLGIQVILRDAPLAGIVLARASRPFDIQETGLLAIAESQIDSAVLQARVFAELRQRNRELESIFQMDRLRDQSTTESEFVSACTNLVVTTFNARLCALFHGDSPSDDPTIRGVLGEGGVPDALLEALHSQAYTFTSPHALSLPPEFSDLHGLAIPLMVGGDRLGAVVLLRDAPFTSADHQLLYAMMTQIDSAIAHFRALEQRFSQRLGQDRLES